MKYNSKDWRRKMAKYVIEGGNKLNGKIEAESAKNAVLPLLAGSILTEE